MRTEIAEGLYKLYNRGYKTLRTLKYGSDMFYIVVIETTTVCTRKCSYCPNSKFDRGVHEMPMSVYKKIMKDLKEMGWNGMIRPFLYGDPLCDKRLPELMKITREYLPHSNIIIYTNGDLMTNEIYDKVIPYVNGFYITNHGNLNPDLPKRPKIVVRKLGKLNNRAGLVDISKDRFVGKWKNCVNSNETLTVYWDGKILLCCQDYFGRMSFGNVKNEKIIDIWKKPEFVKVRKELKEGKPVYEVCKHCLSDKK